MSKRRTRSERISRQSLDDGDPSETVWISGRGCYVYHDDSTCPRLSDPDPKPRQKAQGMWLAPCARCCLDGGES
jgi:hypothetical protein